MAPRALWERVFDDGAKERFVKNVAGHMGNCGVEEIIKRQIGIFREVSGDLAERLEKAMGVKGYDGIRDLSFNGTHNGMARSLDKKVANGMKGTGVSRCESNGAPLSGCHGSNGVAAR